MRWYYEASTGLCQAMNYTGCQGNANRFMTKEECDNSCKHEAKLVIAKRVCSLPKQAGFCPEPRDPQAKWYFDSKDKICTPFYFSGCNGNENNFDSWSECEEACPNTFPPEIEANAKVSDVECKGCDLAVDLQLPKIVGLLHLLPSSMQWMYFSSYTHSLT